VLSSKGHPLALGAILGMALACLAALAAPASAVTITEFEIEPGAKPGTYLPRYIEAGPDGNLWFTEAGTKSGIGRMSTSGERFPQISDPSGPEDLVFTADGTLFWTSDAGVGRRTPLGEASKSGETARESFGIGLTAGGAVRWGEPTFKGTGAFCKFNPSFPAVSCTPPAVQGGTITSVLLGSGGNVWTAWPDLNLIRVYAGEETFPTKIIELPVGAEPKRLALGPEGNVWVTMPGNSTIGRFLADGTRDKPIALPSGSIPDDIVAGPDGNLWVTEFGTEKIARVTPSGEITEYPIPSHSSEPLGITVGPDGAIWFTESGTNKIGRLVPDLPTPPAPPSEAGGGTGGGGTDGGKAPGGPVAAPSFTAAPAFAPRRFATSGTPAALRKAGVKKGSKLTLSLSRPATVSATIFRLAPGRHKGKGCVAPGAAPKGASKCERQIRVGSQSWPAGAGASKLPFSGKVGGRALAPGRYVASVVATDAGQSSEPKSAPFTIVKP
jgi:streptogramin lyase